MSEIQIITLLATCFGLVGTVLNLVAFVREKDKSHTRAGFGFLFLLLFALGIALMPRYAPGVAGRLAARIPAPVAGVLRPWLVPTGTTATAAQAPPADRGVLGSFTIEIQRNLLGGIGALVSNFQFSNPSSQSVRVTAYDIRITRQRGEPSRSYRRVLSEPLTVTGQGNAQTQVELDAEIRDQWVAREGLDAAERGSIEISWQCQAADGSSFTVTASNG